MTDNEKPDLDDRLARLAARRAASSPSPSKIPAAVAATKPTVVELETNSDLIGRPRANPRKKRGHPAAAGRILAAGLTSSAFFSIIAALGAQTPASGSTAVASARPPRVGGFSPTSGPGSAPGHKAKVVVKVRHHTVYVDQYGRRVSPPAALEAAAGSRTGTPPAGGGSAGAAPGGIAYVAPGSPATPGLPTSPGGPTSPGAPSSPVSSPPAGTTPPPPTSPRGPVSGPPAGSAPPPTSAPAPPPSAPPTTVYTPPPPPPPPPPPACTGSKCP